MDVREKLVELLRSAYGTSFNAPHLSEHELEPLASHLIAHGVTVQSEIDAKTYQLMRECERLKEEKESFGNAVNVLEQINSDLCKKLKSVTVQEWISVKDRLPDDNERVIAYRPNEPETSAYKYCVMWGWSVKTSLKHRGITHWCAMPQPPKGE